MAWPAISSRTINARSYTILRGRECTLATTGGTSRNNLCNVTFGASLALALESSVRLSMTIRNLGFEIKYDKYLNYTISAFDAM